jgi:hypothetical protein
VFEREGEGKEREKYVQRDPPSADVFRGPSSSYPLLSGAPARGLLLAMPWSLSASSFSPFLGSVMGRTVQHWCRAGCADRATPSGQDGAASVSPNCSVGHARARGRG